MEFFDKLTKKASQTCKGAAEKTSKFAKETKLKMKISDDKSKIDDLYAEIGKRVYQQHIADENLGIEEQVAGECKKIDELEEEVEAYHKEIVELSNGKLCVNCKQKLDKTAKFCPECGAEQPAVCEQEKDTDTIEVEFIPDESIEKAANENSASNKEAVNESVSSSNDEVEVASENSENSEDSEKNNTDKE